jgi:hypothetical protein
LSIGYVITTSTSLLSWRPICWTHSREGARSHCSTSALLEVGPAAFSGTATCSTRGRTRSPAPVRGRRCSTGLGSRCGEHLRTRRIDLLGLKANGTAVLSTLTRVATYAGDLRPISTDAAVGQLQLVLEGNVLYLDGGWQTLVEGLVAAMGLLVSKCWCSLSAIPPPPCSGVPNEELTSRSQRYGAGWLPRMTRPGKAPQ